MGPPTPPSSLALAHSRELEPPLSPPPTRPAAALQVAEDENGNVWMVDPKTGITYLDSGDDATGILAVAPDGQMYNFFVNPENGKVAEKKLGNVSDLVTVESENFGSITAFPALTGPLPPNIPLSVDPRTGEQEFPPFLEDAEVTMVPKRGLFGGLGGGGKGPLEDLKFDGYMDEKEAAKIEREAQRLQREGKGLRVR